MQISAIAITTAGVDRNRRLATQRLLLAQRDKLRASQREAAIALKDGDTARAVERMESAMLDATRRALAAENALRAIEARIARGNSPYSLASPAVRRHKAA